MKPLPVYALLDVELVRGEGSFVWDADGKKYLDLYGGHAVISIGHSHPAWTKAVQDQAETLAFYSNSVRSSVQEEAAAAMGEICGYPDYDIFFVNSGAEANENALKLASFAMGRSRILAFDGAFHGRTSLAVSVGDNPKIVAPVNETANVTHVPLNDINAVRAELSSNEYAAVIIEGILGVGGVVSPTDEFLRELETACDEFGALLILDEVQSGCGRTGDYFAHQRSGIKPCMITMAKGMGNGFPVGAVIVHPTVPRSLGLLGSTFGGAHMACAAVAAVAQTIRSEDMIKNAKDRGDEIIAAAKEIPHVSEVRGRGLMLGIVLDKPAAPVRKALLSEHGILTGSAADPNILRVLPPLNITKENVERFITALSSVITEELS